ncbi:MAG: type I methionyl aminopeptidase [Desulfobacterales bacterium]|nr:type I methionyl aminopeptidase [Desulfobacterales bacterium]MDX2510610.1 type I methionyl aminopeptidase [Desulfobacterales bacterium]
MKQKFDKVGRNDPCPCGSGLKYKRCCIGREPAPRESLDTLYEREYQIHLKKEPDIEGLRKAGKLVIETLDLAESIVKPGLKTDDINTLVHDFTIQNNAIPAPLNYRGFPKSVCVSVNDVICHGIPGDYQLADGDIVNIDVTSILDGYYADASKTFFVGSPSPKARKIVQVARQSLKEGMVMVKPGNTVGDIGHAIQQYAESKGCSVVRDFVGHGIGTEFHEHPQIPHFGKKAQGVELIPGMVFTIEPMINLGGLSLRILKDKWTAVTKDGSLSAQFEQTLLVTENGLESLTPYNL